ncbi:MAG: rhodanese-related sulfurtransferase [Coleofasciculaceae cyanobacterium SM2_1_6]|nr:rhodanese-related sulfurtransferase [Coleofasciculaceae cyanobacterium SM2_1_6]
MTASVPKVAQISVEELHQVLAANSPEVQLIDVREPTEIAIAQLPGFQVFSLSEFDSWSEKILTLLDTEKETLVLCHHGVRSGQMCQWLASQGFSQVKNIVGGIDAYAGLIDPTVPRY